MPVSGRPPADYGGDPTRERMPFDAPREPPIEAATSDEDVHLIPGATIGGGRYRLLVFHGGPPDLQFWQALDTALDRQVALTFVDPDATLPDEQVQEILSRTLKLSRLDMPGVARVLDVASTGSGGLVVSEWIRGGSLAEVAETSPSPIGGARAIQSLAAAAEAAHRSGVALSIDHPSRVRVSIEGDVALAFPATLPDATPEDDIRGIGAALYALLINRWPLAESGVRSGLAPAELDAAGQPIEPRAVDRDIPFQISAAAARAVQEGGGIRSAPTLLNLLQQATAIADRTELIAPVDEPGAPPPSRFRGAPTDDPESAARRRKGLMIGLGVGGAIIVVALIVLASVLSRIFGDVGGGLGGDQLGLNSPTTSAQARRRRCFNGKIVKPVRATVFSPEGEADAPDRGAAGHRRKSVDRVADRHLHGSGAVPELQERRRADAAVAGAHEARRGHHQPGQHGHRGGDPVVADADTGVAGRHHRADAGHHPQARPEHHQGGQRDTDIERAGVGLHPGQVNGESRSDIAEITLKAVS